MSSKRSYIAQENPLKEEIAKGQENGEEKWNHTPQLMWVSWNRQTQAVQAGRGQFFHSQLHSYLMWFCLSFIFV